jgi:hypothetical protein
MYIAIKNKIQNIINIYYFIVLKDRTYNIKYYKLKCIISILIKVY